MSDAFRLHEVGLVFGSQYALYRLNVDLPAAGVTVVVGENGAGKSTLLSLLAGRLRQKTGKLDRLITPIGYLGHELMLYEDLTGIENVRFFAELWGRSMESKELDAVMDQVGLGPAGLRVVRTYSRGMKQRLAVSKLITSNSRVWLMDEPSTGLDARGRKWLYGVINAAKARGVTVIAASHIPQLVDAVADQVVVLRRGRVVGMIPRAEDFVDRAFMLAEGEGA